MPVLSPPPRAAHLRCECGEGLGVGALSFLIVSPPLTPPHKAEGNTEFADWPFLDQLERFRFRSRGRSAVTGADGAASAFGFSGAAAAGCGCGAVLPTNRALMLPKSSTLAPCLFIMTLCWMTESVLFHAQ